MFVKTRHHIHSHFQLQSHNPHQALEGLLVAFFPTCLRQFTASENIQVAGNIAGRQCLLATLPCPF